ncbi:hypothetical protein [Neoasaia chiangmaiensis]|uniref:hypothetical protein n=1 Tax=Neoasaia chiangmaiensis TaxID=320497 RepID=UPI001474DEF4|nr:hypothetical protein [Neoasaia chiangmaiensis]
MLGTMQFLHHLAWHRHLLMLEAAARIAAISGSTVLVEGDELEIVGDMANEAQNPACG